MLPRLSMSSVSNVSRPVAGGQYQTASVMRATVSTAHHAALRATGMSGTLPPTCILSVLNDFFLLSLIYAFVPPRSLRALPPKYCSDE